MMSEELIWCARDSGEAGGHLVKETRLIVNVKIRNDLIHFSNELKGTWYKIQTA